MEDKHVALRMRCVIAVALWISFALREHTHIMKQPIAFQVQLLCSVMLCEPSSYHEECRSDFDLTAWALLEQSTCCHDANFSGFQGSHASL